MHQDKTPVMDRARAVISCPSCGAEIDLIDSLLSGFSELPGRPGVVAANWDNWGSSLIPCKTPGCGVIVAIHVEVLNANGKESAALEPVSAPDAIGATRQDAARDVSEPCVGCGQPVDLDGSISLWDPDGTMRFCHHDPICLVKAGAAGHRTMENDEEAAS